MDLPLPAESATDPISRVRFSPHESNPAHLLVATWSTHLLLYDTAQLPETSLKTSLKHRAVVLNCAWGPTPTVAYTACADWDVRRADLASNELASLSTHSGPVAYVVCSLEHKLVVSASWGGEMHVQPIDAHGHAASAHTTVRLPAKPTALALAGTKLIVSMVGRQIWVYDTQALATHAAQSPSGEHAFEPYQKRESSLKFATRSLLARPDELGFVTGSIEGRVAVEWFDPAPEQQAKKYAFKCHRQPLPEGEDGDLVYPVHALAWHPQYDTFATGGGDGVVALWDAGAKRRIRQYQKFNAGVSALSFSNDGKKLAISVCPQYEDGMDEEQFPNGPVRVIVRELAEGEAMGRGKSGGKT